MLRLIGLVLLLAVSSLAVSGAETAPDQRTAAEAAKKKLHRERVGMDKWSSAFPRSLAEDPVFFRDGERFGVEMKSTDSVGYYDRLFDLPAAPGAGCRIAGDARTSGGEMYNNVMMILFLMKILV